MNKIIGEQVLAALAKQAAAFEAALAERAERKPDTNKVDYEALAVKAFRKAGYGETKLSDRKTYNLWLAEGFRVKPGEHAVRVKNLRLFHRSQCEVMSAAEKKTALAHLEAKRAKANGEAAPVQAQPAPAPVSPAPRPQRKSTKILIASGGNA
jgi:hypothetical protein